MWRFRFVIKTLISENPNPKFNYTRNFLTSSSSAAAAPTINITPYSFNFNPLFNHNKPYNLSKWIAPVGPLFLSSPPWQLSQSATPLFYLRSKKRGSNVLKKVEALNIIRLNLLRSKALTVDHQPGLLLSSLTETKGVVDSVVDPTLLLKSFVNPPNLISIARLVSGPFLGWMIVNEMYSYAFVGLAISGASDWLDGYVARKMGINSVVGSYLDPLADKVLIGCVAVAMVHNNLLHPGLVGLVLFRDVGLVGGALYQRANSLRWQWKNMADFFNIDKTHPEKVEPLFISKVNTVFQLMLVAAALLQPEFGTPETQTCVKYLSWLVASTTIASTAAYGNLYMRKRSEVISRKR
ncbi:hypothetical protein ACFE04_001678 [Oxalis oulophora]